MLKIRKMCR